MSLLYGFCLIMPRKALRASVEALARHADPEGECKVMIPGQLPIQVPFNGEGEDGPVDVVHVGRSEPATWLNGSLWMPVDDRVRHYLSGHETRSTSTGEEASIGLVSIFLYAGKRYAIMNVGAVTSSMSSMFEDSEAVRTLFVQISKDVRGVTLFSRQTGEPYEFIEQPGSFIRFDYDGDNPESVDRFCAEVFTRAAIAARSGA